MERTLVDERPAMVGFLPTVLALLMLLVLVLSLRIWITSRTLATAQATATRARTLANVHVSGPRTQGRLGLPLPPPGQVQMVERRTWVMIQTAPPNVETFVYANGGALLGRAPIRTAALGPGYHRLLFWAPTIRGRATRTIYVRPDTTTWVSAEVRPSDQF